MQCSKCGQVFVGVSCPKCGYDHSKSKLSKLLVNPGEEEIMACLGNDFAQTFASTGELGNGFAILSDKRVYFKGKCLIRKGKGFYSRTEERTVDLNDVTGTGFMHSNAIWAKILMFLCIGFGILFICITPAGVGYLLLIAALLLKVLHKIYTFSVFEISYAGGGIAFDLNWITLQEAEEFQKKLVLLKQNQKAYDQTSQGRNDASVPQQLKEYNNLLSQGIITQAEFDRKKAELLNSK